MWSRRRLPNLDLGFAALIFGIHGLFKPAMLEKTQRDLFHQIPSSEGPNAILCFRCVLMNKAL